jgi:hypothetical protein
LQAEQQARLEAQLELNRQKKKVAGLEVEVQQQRSAINQVCSLWQGMAQMQVMCVSSRYAVRNTLL